MEEIVEREVRPIDLRSRVGVRAVVSGVLVGISAMTLSLTLAAALGLWDGTFAGLREAKDAFRVWASIAWVASSLAGGWIAAVTGRSVQAKDGLLHGIVTWAALNIGWTVLVFAGVFAAIGAGVIDAGSLRGMEPSSAQLWGKLLGNALALVAALLGGWAGSRSEARGPTLVQRPRERERLAPREPTTQPS